MHFIGTSPYNIWNRIDPLKTETWGREKWGWRMRKIHYAWTPDITTTPFAPWTVVADTLDGVPVARYARLRFCRGELPPSSNPD